MLLSDLGNSDSLDSNSVIERFGLQTSPVLLNCRGPVIRCPMASGQFQHGYLQTDILAELKLRKHASIF